MAGVMDTARTLARPWWTRAMAAGIVLLSLYLIGYSAVAGTLDVGMVLTAPVAAAIIMSLLKALSLLVRVPVATVRGG